MKLTDYARSMGVHHRTARRWFHSGQIPGAYQLPSGTIIVPENKDDNKEEGKTIIYARVSNSTRQTIDLVKQAERLNDYAIANGWKVDRIIKEVGSGLNDNRKALNKILNSEENIDRLIVEHKDRLTRFGYNYIEQIAKLKNFEIIIVNPTMDDQEDLIQDFISIITSYCARLYGQRRGKRKTEALTKELSNAVD